MTDKRSIDVEKLLHWAYRDELPKRGAEWGGKADYAPGFGSSPLVDHATRREPGFPTIMGSPHPDAHAVDSAVQSLSILQVDAAANAEWLCPEFWRLMDADDIALRALEIDPTAYVIGHAKMGTRPSWQLEFEACRMIGKEGFAEALHPDGEPARDCRRRFRWGSYSPLLWYPTATGAAADRAIYVAWREALGELVSVLGDSLERWRVTGPEAPSTPWIGPAGPQRRILSDLRDSVPLPAKQLRRRRKAA